MHKQKIYIYLQPTGSHERLTALLKLFTDKEKAKEAAKAAEAAAFSKSIFDVSLFFAINFSDEFNLIN